MLGLGEAGLRGFERGGSPISFGLASASRALAASSSDLVSAAAGAAEETPTAKASARKERIVRPV